MKVLWSMPLTGSNKVLSLPLKTKDNADPAGLSVPLVPLKDVTSSKTELLFNLFPSNNWLIATDLMTMVAMEVLWTMHLTTSIQTEVSTVKKITLTQHTEILATPQKLRDTLLPLLRTVMLP